MYLKVSLQDLINKHKHTKFCFVLFRTNKTGTIFEIY